MYVKINDTFYSLTTKHTQRNCKYEQDSYNTMILQKILTENEIHYYVFDVTFTVVSGYTFALFRTNAFVSAFLLKMKIGYNKT